jgi:Uncharacterised nucleotidyltransferase
MHHNAITGTNGNPLRAQYAHLLAGGVVLPPMEPVLSNVAFWSRAWREGVGACVWHALQQQGIRLDASIRAQCVEQPLREQVTHTLALRAATAEILEQFADKGIDMIILRGQAVAETLYTPATLRPQTDVDVLVDAADVPRVNELLTGLGFAPLPPLPQVLARGDVLLDVHTEPLGIERIASWALLTPLRAPDFFRHAQRKSMLGVTAIQPDAGVVLPYLSFHAMKHSFERLIWLWDIALLARNIDADGAWDEVATGIAEYALERPCFYALSYASEHLAAPVPTSLLDALQPRMDWRERQMFRRFMRHESVPFMAERIFARMQPDFAHRLAFWRETIWPSEEVRRQVDADPSARGGFMGKRARQIGKAALFLLRELGALFRG